MIYSKFPPIISFIKTYKYLLFLYLFILIIVFCFAFYYDRHYGYTKINDNIEYWWAINSQFGDSKECHKSTEKIVCFVSNPFRDGLDMLQCTNTQCYYLKGSKYNGSM